MKALRLRVPELDLVRTEDVGIKRFQDEQILAWAAEEGRLILTHDAKTFVRAAYERLAKGDRFSGVVLVPSNLTIATAIDEIVVLLLCTSDNELDDRVIRLPL